MKKSTSSVRDKRRAAAPETDQPKNSNHDFLIVAIGASAGGIEAFAELMRNLPPDTGMAFVLIQHLDPKHRSIRRRQASAPGIMRSFPTLRLSLRQRTSPLCATLLFVNWTA